jgi:hypothetical protein
VHITEKELISRYPYHPAHLQACCARSVEWRYRPEVWNIVMERGITEYIWFLEDDISVVNVSLFKSTVTDSIAQIIRTARTDDLIAVLGDKPWTAWTAKMSTYIPAKPMYASNAFLRVSRRLLHAWDRELKKGNYVWAEYALHDIATRYNYTIHDLKTSEITYSYLWKPKKTHATFFIHDWDNVLK